MSFEKDIICRVQMNCAPWITCSRQLSVSERPPISEKMGYLRTLFGQGPCELGKDFRGFFYKRAALKLITATILSLPSERAHWRHLPGCSLHRLVELWSTLQMQIRMTRSVRFVFPPERGGRFQSRMFAFLSPNLGPGCPCV